MTWLQVPSTFPMTKAQAYQFAINRWSVDSAEARQSLIEEEIAGIEYQSGNHAEKAAWQDLPAPANS